MLNRHSQKPSQDRTWVGSEAKNPLPARVPGINAMDFLGLSWIIVDNVSSKEIIMGGK